MGAELASLDEVVAQADFITIHLPKSPETTGLINADCARAGQTRGPHRQHGPRRDHRREGPGPGGGQRDRGRRRPRRVRRRADYFVAPVRAGPGGGHAPPRRQHPGSPGQGRGDHRRAGAAGAGRRLRSLRGQHRRHRGSRGGPALVARRRAPRPHVGGVGPRAAHRPRHRVPRRPGRPRQPHTVPGRPEGPVLGGHRRARLLRERPPAGRGEGPGRAFHGRVRSAGQPDRATPT